MIDNAGLVLLLVSCAISFGVGKIFVHFRNKKRQAATDKAALAAERLRRAQAPEPPSRNKSKRKRQQQQDHQDHQEQQEHQEQGKDVV